MSSAPAGTPPAELAAGFDLRHLAPAFYDDPFPTYRALRTLQPVKRMPDGSVLLTRCGDVVAVYKDPKTYSSDKREEFGPKYGASALLEHHTTSLVFNDPPLHTRVRRLIGGAPTPRHVEAMEDGLVRHVERLLDAMEARAKAGETIELIESFRGAIPVESIGNLLGVAMAERAPLRTWSFAILGALEPSLTARRWQRGGQANACLPRGPRRRARRLTARPRDRRADPPHSGRGDRGRWRARTASREGAAAQLHFLAQRGSRNDDQPDRQRAQVPARLAGSEAAPGGRTPACQDGGGGAIADRELQPTGQPHHPCARPRSAALCSRRRPRSPCASVRPSAIPHSLSPDVLDITRAPKRHVAFGSGIHQCVGMGLARLEGRVAIGGFLARFPKFRLNGPAVRSRRARFRGHVALPCALLG